MAEGVLTGFIVRRNYGWCVLSGNDLYRIVDEDASLCLDSDYGTKVNFHTITNGSGIFLAKLSETVSKDMSWDEIAQWYDSDNYPPFGGPFTDALPPFEWLKKNFNPPRIKKETEK